MDRPEADRTGHALDNLLLVELDLGQVLCGWQLNVFKNRAGPEEYDGDEANEDGPESDYCSFHRGILAAAADPNKPN